MRSQFHPGRPVALYRGLITLLGQTLTCGAAAQNSGWAPTATRTITRANFAGVGQVPDAGGARRQPIGSRVKNVLVAIGVTVVIFSLAEGILVWVFDDPWFSGFAFAKSACVAGLAMDHVRVGFDDAHAARSGETIHVWWYEGHVRTPFEDVTGPQDADCVFDPRTNATTIHMR